MPTIRPATGVAARRPSARRSSGARPTRRRSSAINIARAIERRRSQAADLLQDTPGAPGAARPPEGHSYEILKHGGAVLGSSLLLVLVATLLLLALRALPWPVEISAASKQHTFSDRTRCRRAQLRPGCSFLL